MPRKPCASLPHEVVLTAKTTTDGVTARLWSDKRQGGDGLVRSIRYHDGATIARDAPLDLGTDAVAIGKVVLANDGIWAVTLDQAGAPAELLHYAPQKSNRCYSCARFALAELCAQAVVVDLAKLRD